MVSMLNYLKNINGWSVIKWLGHLLLVYILLLFCKYLFTGDLSIRRTEFIVLISAFITLSSKIFKNKTLYYVLSLLLTTVLTSPLVIKFITGEVILAENVIKFIGFNFAISSAGLLVGNIISQYRIGRVVNAVLCLLLFIPTLIFWCYYLTSGALFGVDTLLAIMQTNASESKEFLADNYNLDAILFLVFTIAMILALVLNLHHLTLRMKGKKLYFAVILFLVCDALLIYKCKGNMLTYLIKDTKIYYAKYEDFSKHQEARKANVQKLVNVETGDKGIYVLVIGESQNKLHMQAYGYQRPTTPWLMDMQSDKNFLLFNNVYSCHTHTVPTLVYALTAKNQYNSMKLENAVSLLEAAEAAGYETAWLSNQVQYSSWDTPITVIASEANQQIWLNKNVGETSRTNFYDGKLADSIDKIKLSDKMLIVIHLMGNHGSYAERYPKEFTKFTGRNSIDYYDNSILYNDYVMKQIYEHIKALPNFKAMVYFSDHADAVDDGLFHDSSKFVLNMTKIPFYMYLSDNFINERQDDFWNLQHDRSKPMTNDLVFNTMLGILNIKLNGIYEADNDILSNDYNDDLSRFKTLYGKKSIEKELEKSK